MIWSVSCVKKSVVGAGHATKDQVRLMVCRLLPGSEPKNDDESDALAIAICHAHFSLTNEHWQKSGTMAGR